MSIDNFRVHIDIPQSLLYEAWDWCWSRGCLMSRYDGDFHNDYIDVVVADVRDLLGGYPYARFQFISRSLATEFKLTWGGK